MSTHTLAVRPDVVLPSVNLIPPEIAEARRFQRARALMLLTVAGAAVAVGGLYYQAHHSVQTAQQQLASAQQQETRLQAQAASFHEVVTINAEVAADKALLTEAMGQEIQWSTYLNDLSLKIPANVWLTSLNASETSPGTSTTATPGSPASSIGTVTFGGVALSHNDVATWLESLATESGYTDPYFSSSTESTIGSRKVVNFSSTVQLTPAALSGRYTTTAGG